MLPEALTQFLIKLGMCQHWACLSAYFLSKLDEDYLYMAYADIMAKVSSCLCPARVPFSPAAASHKLKGLPGGWTGHLLCSLTN